MTNVTPDVRKRLQRLREELQSLVALLTPTPDHAETCDCTSCKTFHNVHEADDYIGAAALCCDWTLERR